VDFPIVIVGYDFRAAAPCVREKLLLDSEARLRLARRLKQAEPEMGLAILETCNRVEWLSATARPGPMLTELTAQMRAVLRCELAAATIPAPGQYVGRFAVRHWLQLAMGLESLALGEAQIAGQLQQTLADARSACTSSPYLNALGNAAGRAAKAAGRIGFRSDASRGVHCLADRFLADYFHGQPAPKVVVLGMGGVGRRVATALGRRWPGGVVCVNRTLPEPRSSAWREWRDLGNLSRQAQALVVATGYDQPLLFTSMLDLNSRGGPLLILDLGMPRQTDPALARDPRIRYCQLEDLLQVGQDRADAETRAALDQILAREIDRFARFCRERPWVGLIRAIDQHRRACQAATLACQADVPGRKQRVCALHHVVGRSTHRVFASIHASLQAGPLANAWPETQEEVLCHDPQKNPDALPLQPPGAPSGRGGAAPASRLCRVRGYCAGNLG